MAVRLDKAGRIDADVSCLKCGYNLRMQPAAADCPECGQAIDVNDLAADDAMERADPAWRTSLHRGAKLLHFGVLLIPIAIVLPLIVAAVTHQLGYHTIDQIAILAAAFGGTFALSLAAAGVWKLTLREPGKPEHWMARGTRLSARWASVGSAVGAWTLLVLATQREGGFTARSLVGLDWKVYDILLCGVGASAAVAMLEAWRHLFKLAARAGGPDVAQACRRAWKRYLIGVAVLVVMSAAVTVADRLDIKAIANAYIYFASASVLIVGAVLLWLWWTTLGLTSKLRRLLSDT
jgi:hypothetical protein